jgi:hypothetical protein
MRVQGRRALFAGICTLLVGAGVAGCGSKPRQDENEVSGDFPVEVTVAKFPARQRLADTSDLELAFRNTGDDTIPDLAVTIYTGDEKADGSFNQRSEQQGLADPNRPVWILENDYPKLLGPTTDTKDLDTAPTAGAETSSTDTYAFGPVAPDETVHAVWRVTPVVGGTFTVHYEVAGGLDGKARAVTDDGSPVEGEFVATISTKPPSTHVTESGDVVEQK